MKKKDALELLRKYRSGNCTEEEKALVEAWYSQWEAEGPDLSEEELKAMKEQTWQQLSPSDKNERVLSNWYRYAAAVVVFGSLSAGIWMHFTKGQPEIAQQKDVTRVHQNDAAPGGNKAILTLGDGTVISLAEAQNGKIAEVNGTDIRKTADGQVVYEAEAPVSRGEQVLKYNQISTPRGGQYHITLRDGTEVWLNAASSLKYPVVFSEERREVELSGEAYFEVTSLKSDAGERIPFVVNTSTQTVEVLGTRFNINSYEDEVTVNTTLLEGVVRVSGKSDENHKGFILKPNQQSLFTGNDVQIKEVDAEDIVAWKNGYFSFNHADIKAVMRQLSRWYDLDVEYEGKVPAGTFSGMVDRNLRLSTVLEILAYSQVDFRIEGKKIIIFS